MTERPATRLKRCEQGCRGLSKAKIRGYTIYEAHWKIGHNKVPKENSDDDVRTRVTTARFRCQDIIRTALEDYDSSIISFTKIMEESWGSAGIP